MLPNVSRLHNSVGRASHRRNDVTTAWIKNTIRRYDGTARCQRELPVSSQPMGLESEKSV